jgi:putative tryptophan/tyrosine transport system substrate-binding protein
MLDFRRREFLALLGGMAATWPLAAPAQQSAKVLRIGMLETIAAELNAANLAAFRKSLRDLGYAEGRNLVIEYRSADGRAERFPEAAAELVSLKVDVIVTRGTPASLAAKNATATIPIVMAAVAEPLGSGLVDTLARPGGNVTGLSSSIAMLDAKRVELLQEVVPGIVRVAVFFNMGNPVQLDEWNAVQTAAQAKGIQPLLLDVRRAEEIGLAFDAARMRQCGALVVGADAIMQANAKLISELAATNRLPAIYASREFIEAGGLLAYGASYADLYRRAAIYVGKLLQGAKPADLPVEQPTKFELVINLKAAKALGLAIAPLIIARADEVIE